MKDSALAFRPACAEIGCFWHLCAHCRPDALILALCRTISDGTAATDFFRIGFRCSPWDIYLCHPYFYRIVLPTASWLPDWCLRSSGPAHPPVRQRHDRLSCRLQSHRHHSRNDGGIAGAPAHWIRRALRFHCPNLLRPLYCAGTSARQAVRTSGVGAYPGRAGRHRGERAGCLISSEQKRTSPRDFIACCQCAAHTRADLE